MAITKTPKRLATGESPKSVKSKVLKAQKTTKVAELNGTSAPATDRKSKKLKQVKEEVHEPVTTPLSKKSKSKTSKQKEVQTPPNKQKEKKAAKVVTSNQKEVQTPPKKQKGKKAAKVVTSNKKEVQTSPKKQKGKKAAKIAKVKKQEYEDSEEGEDAAEVMGGEESEVEEDDEAESDAEVEEDNEAESDAEVEEDSEGEGADEVMEEESEEEITIKKKSLPTKKELDKTAKKEKSSKRKRGEGDDDGPEKKKPTFEHEVWVGKLDYRTTAETLKKHFSRFGALVNVTLPKKSGVEDTNKGFGYVAFETEETAKAAASYTDHFIDSRKVVVNNNKKEPELKKSTKELIFEHEVWVGSINFRTTRETLKSHFSHFGTVINVTLPKKPGKEDNKGFGFIAFDTAEAAEAAAACDDHSIDSRKLIVNNKTEPKNSEKDLHTNELFVASLCKKTDKDTLQKHFSKYGNITNITLPWHRQNNQNKGYMFVAYETEESFKNALAEDHEIDGSKLVVRTGITEKGNRGEGDDDGPEKKKATFEHEVYVGKLNFTTTVETLKEYFSQFGTVINVTLPKKPGDDDNRGFAFVAFDTADPAEAVTVCKDHLIDSKEVFVQSKKGPKKIEKETINELFVASLCKTTDVETLQKHFSKYGNITKISLPWNKQTDQNKGYMFVAYETAESRQSALAEDHQIDGSRLVVEKAGNSEKRKRGEGDDDGPQRKKSTFEHQVFVGKLNYTTTAETLKEYFSQFGTVIDVSLPKNPGEDDNKGFAFVAFDTAAPAEAITTRKDHLIDSREVTVERKKESIKLENEMPPSPEKKKRTFEQEVYVGKLNFATTAETLKKHFSQFGTVVNVTLPKKAGEEDNKGFGFVAFDTTEAVNVASACKYHLIDSSEVTVDGKNESKKFEKEKPQHANELFITSLCKTTDKETLQEHFSKYGNITNITMPWSKQANQNKGYMFVAYESAESLQSALAEGHEIDGSKLTVKSGNDKKQFKSDKNKQQQEKSRETDEEDDE